MNATTRSVHAGSDLRRSFSTKGLFGGAGAHCFLWEVTRLKGSRTTGLSFNNAVYIISLLYVSDILGWYRVIYQNVQFGKWLCRLPCLVLYQQSGRFPQDFGNVFKTVQSTIYDNFLRKRCLYTRDLQAILKVSNVKVKNKWEATTPLYSRSLTNIFQSLLAVFRLDSFILSGDTFQNSTWINLQRLEPC